jgi:hypothetical protein
MLGVPAVREGESKGEVSSFCSFHHFRPLRHSRAGGIQGGSAESLVLVTLDSRLRGNDVVGGGITPLSSVTSPPSLASLGRYRS